MANFIQNLLFKKTSTFIFCGVVAAFAIETYIDVLSDKIFCSINRGLLWEHIKDNYKKAKD